MMTARHQAVERRLLAVVEHRVQGVEAWPHRADHLEPGRHRRLGAGEAGRGIGARVRRDERLAGATERRRAAADLIGERGPCRPLWLGDREPALGDGDRILDPFRTLRAAQPRETAAAMMAEHRGHGAAGAVGGRRRPDQAEARGGGERTGCDRGRDTAALVDQREGADQSERGHTGNQHSLLHVHGLLHP